MASIGIKLQNVKENAFPTATESHGLVRAFLELDECASGSDEEFLDFQFRIADADANLREREASERMADWRASFATLQLKQAHEVADFASARRKEDEVRIDSQAKEINELRRALEVAMLETEQAKASCFIVTQGKLKVEEELGHQRRVCNNFRKKANEMSQAQERMLSENMEMKRALDEALVTTCRLKVALEEKAAELVAWLGHEGLGLQGPLPLATEVELSPKAEEKNAYTVQPVGSQELETLLTGEETVPVEVEVSIEDGTSKEEEDLSTSATEKMMIGLEMEFEDMKHEVLIDIPKYAQSKEEAQCSDLTAEVKSGIECKEERRAEDILSFMGKEVVVSLRRKISELQLELQRLQSLDSLLNDQHPNMSGEHQDARHVLGQASILEDHQDHREVNDSSTTNKEPDGIELGEPALTESSSDGTCANIDMAHDKQLEDQKSRITLGSAGSFSEETKVAHLEMAGKQIKESGVRLEHTTGDLDSLVDLEDKFVCFGRNQPWSIESISTVVESITEELTKLLRVVAKTPNASNQNYFSSLEMKVKSWSNVTTKTLQSKLSSPGAVEEWKSLVVDFLGQSRQELMAVQQRLCDYQSELALMDKLQAECLESSQNLCLLEDEIQKLEAQSFNDNIEREEEVNLLKEELEKAKQTVVEAHSKAAEEQLVVIALREKLQDSEIELETAKLGWAAEQEFINSCLGGGREEAEVRTVRREDMESMEEQMEELICRLEENDRELGELLISGGVNTNSLMAAKIRRLEQRLEDAKASEVALVAEREELISQVTSVRARLEEVEYELQLENQQHVEMLIRYEEEQGHVEASTRSETGVVEEKLLQMEQLLSDKSEQLVAAQGGQGISASQCQLLTLRARVLTLESNLAITRQKAVDCEAAIKMQLNMEKDKYASLELKFSSLQSKIATLKKQLSETEQKEKRAQTKIDRLLVELGIAKEEVLKYEVRLQKTIRQATEDVDAEKRKHESTMNSQKQMEWHLCRQIELTEALEREKGKLRDVLEEFELQNLALQKDSDNLRNAYLRLARRADQRGG